jgi:hypothetical protein
MEFRAQEKDVHIKLENAHGSLQVNYKNPDLH